MLKVKLLLALLCLVLVGCGQKGPLLVKPETPSQESPEKES